MERASEAEPGGLTYLREHQRQLDQDGIEVAVSRQALEETFAFIDEILASRPDDAEPVANTAQNRKWCFICAGADDDPCFDYCRVCGREANPIPTGHSRPINEGALGRAVRLARGDIEPEDVPGVIQAWSDGKARSTVPDQAPHPATSEAWRAPDGFVSSEGELDDAAENLRIAIGMGWDLDGVLQQMQDAIAHHTAPVPPLPAKAESGATDRIGAVGYWFGKQVTRLSVPGSVGGVQTITATFADGSTVTVEAPDVERAWINLREVGRVLAPQPPANTGKGDL